MFPLPAPPSSTEQTHSKTYMKTQPNSEASEPEKRIEVMPRRKHKLIDDKAYRPWFRNAHCESGIKSKHRKANMRNRLGNSSGNTRRQSSTIKQSPTLLSNHTDTGTLSMESPTTTSTLPLRASPDLVHPRPLDDDWSPEELDLLKDLADQGLEWETVAMELVEKSVDECRDRYLDMHMSLLGTRWDEWFEEDDDESVGEVEDGAEGEGRRGGGGGDGNEKGNRVSDDGVKKAYAQPKNIPRHQIPPRSLSLPAVPALPSQILLSTASTISTAYAVAPDLQIGISSAPFRFITYPPRGTTTVIKPAGPHSTPLYQQPPLLPATTPRSLVPTPFSLLPSSTNLRPAPAPTPQSHPASTRPLMQLYPRVIRPVPELRDKGEEGGVMQTETPVTGDADRGEEMKTRIGEAEPSEEMQNGRRERARESVTGSTSSSKSGTGTGTSNRRYTSTTRIRNSNSSWRGGSSASGRGFKFKDGIWYRRYRRTNGRGREVWFGDKGGWDRG